MVAHVSDGKVLVLGDDTRSFLAVARSLGRRGVVVHAAPANFRSVALRSRFIAAIHDLPPWMGDGADWLASIEALLEVERFDLLIPCDETTLLPLQHYRDRLTALTRLAIPDDEAISLLFDKHETRELARRLAVPVADGRLLRPDDTAESVLAEFGAPVVVKPRCSYSLETLGLRGKVELLADPILLRRALSARIPEQTVVEQFFDGNGIGVSLLASRGRVLQAFEHHRVHELAGASFYRVSAPLQPDLLDACASIVADTRYTGLAMFEFKLDANGSWILLEINARPWGSMPLPIALGVDFPYLWYRLLIAGEESPAVRYRVGVYGRNLVPDLRAAAAEARQLPLKARVWFAISRAAELLRPLSGREVYDLLVPDDPSPGLAELGESAAKVWRRTVHSFPGTLRRRRSIARRRVRKALRSDAGKPFILFVCQGNICRSPFAEAMARSRFGDSIIVGSAGMIPQPGRPTPDLGLKAAAAHGIDLSAHRSTWLTPEALEVAAAVIVFDQVNCTALFNRYPHIKAPVICLGQLIGLTNIHDPIDGELATFQRVYEQIASGIAELAPLLRHRKQFAVDELSA